MVMVGQHRRLSQPLRWTRAGVVATASAGAALIAAAIVVVVLAASAAKSRAGCIEVVVPSTLGAALVHQCGARARATCASPAQNPALAEHGALRQACRAARLPYGRT